MNRSLVLVVDDRAINIQTVGALLTRAGYEVMPALSGEQALSRCAQRLPDLILLDMQMPGMDGFEVCRRLKADTDTRHLPVIFLTASHEREKLVQAFAEGAVDYVTKPFVAEELLARVKTHLELKAARDHLAQLARERADLTQIVAHDLKNPLTSILFTADMLTRSSDKPERQAELIGGLRESVHRCLEFIDGYLGRWAQSDTPRPVDVQSFESGPILQAAVEGLTPAAAAKNMQIALSAAHAPAVLGNASALRRVLDNLISNALRYAPAGSAIDVHCITGKSGMAKISIMDRGPGIPADRQQQLFKRYVRLATTEQVAHSSGLGLAIAKEEVDRMGGHLWYEDRDGGGAQFNLVLPLAET